MVPCVCVIAHMEEIGNSVHQQDLTKAQNAPYVDADHIKYAAAIT